MKPTARLRSFLFFVGSSLLVNSAQAAIYYWDTDGNIAGFGSTGGTWNSGNTALWSTSSAGTATTPNVTINSLDDINFGTAANSYSGTVTLSGNTTARSTTFSGSSNVVLKGNGTARTLTLGSGGLTMNGTSTVTLGDGVAGNNLLIGLGTKGQIWTNNTANNLSILNTAATFSRSAGGTITFNKTSSGEFSMSATVLPNEASGIIGPWAFFGTGTNTRYAYNNSGTIAGYSAGTAATDAEAFTSATTNYDFSTTAPTTLTANRTANTIRYNGTGNTIDLGASGANTLTTNGILAVGSSGTLTIQRSGGTGTLVAGSTGTNSELIIAGPQNISISAPISNGLGNSALTYSGTGTLTLSGDNTYSGGNTVNSGTLVVGSATALGATGKALNVNGTGTLNLNGFDYTVGAFNGDSGNATVTNSGATVKAFTVGSGNANGVFAGAITGNLSLTKIGTGALNLGTINTYSGGTNLNGTGPSINIAPGMFGTGTITFGANNTLNTVYGAYYSFTNAVAVNPDVTATFSTGNQYHGYSFQGALTGSGTVQLTNASNAVNGGSPKLGFTNAANTFSGTLIINTSGTVSVNSLGDSASAGTNPLRLGVGGGIELRSGTATSLTFTNRPVQLTGAAGTSTIINNSNNGSIITISQNLGASSVTGAKTLTLDGTSTGNNTFGGIIANLSGQTVSVSKAGVGTWILSGANTYTGATTLSGGTLSVGASNNLGASGANLVFDGGTLRVTGSALSSISGIGHTVVLNATKTVGLDIQNAAHTFTVDQVLNQTTGGFTKNGAGTVVLNQTNSYTGTTTLNAGTLRLDYSTGNTARFAGALALNGGTLELSGGSSYTQAATSTTLNNGTTFITQTNSGTNKLALGAITFTGGGINFAAGNIATTTTANATAGHLGANGTARLTVAGADLASNDGAGNIVAYTGYTNFTGGAATAANINYSTLGNATLTAARGATTNIFKINTGVAGQSMELGNFNLTLGSMLFAGGHDYSVAASGAGTGRFGSAFILHNYGAGNLTLGALGGDLTQFGTGNTILSQNSAADSTLNVNGGTVQISSNAQIGTSATVKAITLNNGTLLASETLALNNGGLNSRTITLGSGGGTLAAASTKNLTISGVISGAGNSLTIGNATSNGTVTLTGANTYTGATTVSNGTLIVDGNISTSILTTVETGATLGGSGTVGDLTIDSGGFHNPGNSPSIQNTGDYSLAGTLGIEIDGNTPGVGGYDQVNTTGTVNLTGALSITMGYTPAANQLFFILANDLEDAITGTFSNAPIDGNTYTLGGQSFQISYFANQTAPGVGTFTGGNDIALMAIPEPRAALLGGLGMLLLLRRRRN